MGALYPIRIDQGATFELTAQWKQNGTGVDLSSGWTAKLQVRSLPSSTTVECEGSTGSGTITLGADGTVQVNIVPADTANATPGAAVYDLILTRTADGFVKRLLEGPAAISAQVTTQ